MRIPILLIAYSLTGCLSQNKLAQKCADRFPIKEQIKEVIVVDTIYTKGDTIKMGFKDTSFSFICPPNKTIVKTKEVKITAENTAKSYLMKKEHQNEINKLNDECDHQIKLLNAELKKQIKDIDNLKQKLENVKKYKHRFYFLLLVIIVYFALKFSFKKWLSLL